MCSAAICGGKCYEVNFKKLVKSKDMIFGKGLEISLGHQFIYSWLSFSISRCLYFEYFLYFSIQLSFLFLKSRDYFDQCEGQK